MHLRVAVDTGAKRERVEKVAEGRYKIAVKEPAAENRANERVRALLARELGVALAKVRIVSGHHKPSKIFAIGV